MVIPSQSEIISSIERTGFIEIDSVRTSDPDRFLSTLVSSFAKPVSYFDQPMIMDVRPKEGANPASYAGTGRLDLHTDISWYSEPPTYVAMICIDPGESGGLPFISDGWEALANLDLSTIEELETRSVRFAAPDHVDYLGYTAPIVSQNRGKYRIRFRPDLLKDKMSDAIDCFVQATNERARNIPVSSGSIWIIDNYRMLHGRTEIPHGGSVKRFFKRMYGVAL